MVRGHLSLGGKSVAKSAVSPQAIRMEWCFQDFEQNG
jgi:hypothetical protein